MAANYSARMIPLPLVPGKSSCHSSLDSDWLVFAVRALSDLTLELRVRDSVIAAWAAQLTEALSQLRG
jgi:hypothetical protein